MKKSISLIPFLLAGAFFGIILVKSEVMSWYRIYEMFRFESFHMYGIIFTAIATSFVSLQIIKKMRLKSLDGQEIALKQKPMHKGIWIGGFIFGLGWALTGACPGPIFALIGVGYDIYILILVSALAGAFLYEQFKHKLP